MRVAVLILTSLALAGCAEEAGLWLEAQAPGIEHEIDGVVVEIVASRGPGTGSDETTCWPVERRLPNDFTDLEFPFLVVVRPGNSEYRNVVVRVTGFSGREQVIRSQNIYRPDWDAVNQEEMILTRSCLRFPCHDEAACVDVGGGPECENLVGELFLTPHEVSRTCDGAYHAPE